MKNDNNSTKARDIFYGVVAIATLIVAMVGATLAYFSVTAYSNEGAVNATAATVRIEYDDTKQVSIQAQNLIPATFFEDDGTDGVVKQVYESIYPEWNPETPLESNACIDDKGQEVCSVYRFTINSSVERDITAKLYNLHNTFNYLSYAVYDVTAGKWVDLEGEGDYVRATKICNNANVPPDDDCYALGTNDKIVYNETLVNSIFGYTTQGTDVVVKPLNISGEHTYDLVLFIEETGENQDVDQGANYRGQIIINVVGLDTEVTGCVGDDCD